MERVAEDIDMMTPRDEFVNIENIFVFGRLDELQNH